MIRIVLDGRTDLKDYFKLSGVFDKEKLDHTPLLVFIASEETITVRIIDKPIMLLDFADENPVMGQWAGKWHSDFFQFTVGQSRQYVDTKQEFLKSARNVCKTVGPQGGFRYLSYEYVDEHGTAVHATNGSKAEADRLEAFFVSQNITITTQKTH